MSAASIAPRRTLFGIDLTFEPESQSWAGEVGSVRLRVHQIRHEEPLRFAAYAILTRPHGGPTQLACGAGGAIESAIALCEDDARERAGALHTLGVDGTLEQYLADAAQPEVCS